MREREVRAGRAVVLSLVLILAMPLQANATHADGASDCIPFQGQSTHGEVASSQFFLYGSRSTIEGQPLTLCSGGVHPSGSFHWAAIQYFHPSDETGSDIVQIGFGRCARANGPQCDGAYHWYWAWGSDCGSTIDGSGGQYGAIPLRIGASLSSLPTTDFYVMRTTINGVMHYAGFVNGVNLHGTGANGQHIYARVPASEVCWDGLGGSNRTIAWFGETFNRGDSMGGWVSSVRNHLDHDPLRYSYNVGWKVPSLPTDVRCNGSDPFDAVYDCWIPETDHIFIDTKER